MVSFLDIASSSFQRCASFVLCHHSSAVTIIGDYALFSVIQSSGVMKRAQQRFINREAAKLLSGFSGTSNTDSNLSTFSETSNAFHHVTDTSEPSTSALPCSPISAYAPASKLRVVCCSDEDEEQPVFRNSLIKEEPHSSHSGSPANDYNASPDSDTQPSDEVASSPVEDSSHLQLQETSSQSDIIKILLNEIKKNTEAFERTSREIIRMQAQISELTAVVLGGTQSSSHIVSRLPLSSKSDFDDFLALLQDHASRSAFSQFVSSMMISELDDSIRRCLAAIMKDDLAVQFSRKGQRGKLNFSSSTVYLLLQKCAIQRFGGGCVRKFEKIVSEWLKHSKARLH